MGLDILKTTEISKIRKLGTFGVIDANIFDKSYMHYANPEFWGVGRDMGWTQMASNGAMANDRKSELVVISGVPHIYTFYGEIGGTGGYNSDGHTSLTRDVWSYNIDTNIWTWRGQVGDPRKEGGSCVCNGTIYTFGGSSGPPGPQTADFMRFTPPSVSQSTVPVSSGSGPSARARCSMTAHNHRDLGWCVYVYGGVPVSGNTNYVQQKVLYRYEIDARKWTAMASSVYNGVYSSFETVGDYLYAIGGNSTNGDSRGTTTKIERFDVYAETWTTMGVYGISFGEDGCAVIGTKIYSQGQAHPNAQGRCRIWVYDTVLDTVTFRFPGGDFYGEGDMVSYKNALYMVPGVNKYGRSNILWKWDVNDFTLVIRKVS